MAVKFQVRLDDSEMQPILGFQYNTDSDDLEEQTFRQFVALANDAANKITVTETANQNGTTDIVLAIEPVTP